MGWRNPQDISEFEVQAIAYFKLKEIYKNVRGEYHYKYNGKQAARFDIVILNDDMEISVIVEVKSKHTDKSWTQVAKYSAMTGKPCLYIKGEAQAARADDLIRNFLKQEGMEDLDILLRK